jgi:hypothetical protein
MAVGRDEVAGVRSTTSEDVGRRPRLNVPRPRTLEERLSLGALTSVIMPSQN